MCLANMQAQRELWQLSSDNQHWSQGGGENLQAQPSSLGWALHHARSEV